MTIASCNGKPTIQDLLRESKLAGVSWEVVGNRLLPSGRSDSATAEIVRQVRSREREAIEFLDPRPSESELDAIDDSKREKYPDAIANEAHHGLAGEVVRAILPHTESDGTALLLQFLAGFGSVIGRGAHFRAEGDRHHGNLFLVLVGATAKGRKGSSWGWVRRLFLQVDEEWSKTRTASGLSTGEGLTWAVRDPVVKQEAIREGKGKASRIVGYQSAVVDEGIRDKRLFAIEPEFASVLQVAARDRNTLSAILRQAWDGVPLRVLTRNNSVTATDPHISVVGHITRDELRRLISANDMSNGLANRFLWACVRRSKCLADGSSVSEDVIERLAGLVREAVGFVRDLGGDFLIDRDSEARDIWLEVYPQLSMGRPGLLGAATSRAESQVMRLAMLYSLIDCSERIRAAHLLAGLSAWSYCEASARFIFGSKLGDRIADRVVEALRGGDGALTRTDISHALSGHATRDQIREALELLIDQGLIVIDRAEPEGRGRPIETIRLA